MNQRKTRENLQNFSQKPRSTEIPCNLIRKTLNQKNEETFVQVGNPDYEALRKFEEVVKKKLKEVGKSLEASLLKRVEENNEHTEEEFNIVMNQSKTYDESIQNKQPSGETTSTVTRNINLSTIMKETRNGELAEESVEKLRSCNFIIQGVNVASSSDKNETKKEDKDFVTHLMGTLIIKPVTFKSVRESVRQTKLEKDLLKLSWITRKTRIKL